jgi:hypothetical protein
LGFVDVPFDELCAKTGQHQHGQIIGKIHESDGANQQKPEVQEKVESDDMELRELFDMTVE